MNETMKTLLERRSIRKFKPDMVEKEKLEQIIQAGLYAPSAKGCQGTKIIAVTNKALRDEISAMNAKILGKEDSDPFYGAPVVMIVLADKSTTTALYNGSLVMGNLMNAAHSLGLGSIWIHRAQEEFDMDFGKDILKKLGIEGDWEGIGHCAVGYCDCENPTPVPRKENRVYWVE